MPRTQLPVSKGAIKAIRIGRGLTVPQLARMADVDRAQIWRWERGDSVPYEPSLKRLADALGVPMSALLDEGLVA